MIECCICQEKFIDPRVLPCIHTFCLKCLERAGKGKKPGSLMPCPLCRKDFTIPNDGFSGIQKNFFMERLLDMQKSSKTVNCATYCDLCREESEEIQDGAALASMYCIECCQNLCEACCKMHKRIKSTLDHELVDFKNQGMAEHIPSKLVQNCCTVHKSKFIEMFCFDCDLPICVMCFTEHHQMHKCAEVNKVAEDFRKQLQTSVRRVSACV